MLLMIFMLLHVLQRVVGGRPFATSDPCHLLPAVCVLAHFSEKQSKQIKQTTDFCHFYGVY